jgi:hypothetical protein
MRFSMKLKKCSENKYGFDNDSLTPQFIMMAAQALKPSNVRNQCTVTNASSQKMTSDVFQHTIDSVVLI